MANFSIFVVWNVTSKCFNPFDIDVKSVLKDVQVEFIELRNELGPKAKFLSKLLLELCEECLPKTRFPKILKHARN